MSWQQLRRSRLHVDTRCAIADIPLHEVSRAFERARPRGARQEVSEGLKVPPDHGT